MRPENLTFGAGVTALLNAVAGLAANGCLVSHAWIHPDLPAWAAALGARVHLLAEDAETAEIEKTLAEQRPDLLHLDRPSVAGRSICLDDLEALAARVSESDTVVSVDEAYGSYFGGADSAVPLVNRCSNLVVLRSLSKAYCWGGMRAGFAVASPALGARLRERIPPLQVSETSFQLALRLLAEGDVFAGLRRRVEEVKPEVVAALRRLGLEVVEGHSALPWVCSCATMTAPLAEPWPAGVSTARNWPSMLLQTLSPRGWSSWRSRCHDNARRCSEAGLAILRDRRARMQLQELVRQVYARFPLHQAMEDLAELTRYDRYQASEEIEAAADRVAEAAQRYGVQDVKIRRLPADGERHWWTFRAPTSWTPTSATLEVCRGSGTRTVASYPQQDFCLAVHSAPTLADGMVAPLVEMTPRDGELRGKIVVLAPSGEPLSAAIRRLEQAGALGFVAAAGNVPAGSAGPLIGRIELPGHSRVFGFSVDRAVLEELRHAAACGAQARARVEVRHRAATPLVDGRLPGAGSEEILLTAHLCHQRPGANDNASGVAASLGLAQVLSDLGRLGGSSAWRRGVRFVWGRSSWEWRHFYTTWSALARRRCLDGPSTWTW